MKAFKCALFSAVVSAQDDDVEEFNRRIDLLSGSRENQRQFEIEKKRNECKGFIED